jgi:hypothetical protein
MRDTVTAATVAHDLPRTALLRPPVQFGVGGPFHAAAIPELSAIAGPEYLLTISGNGEIDKLDEKLMARQIAWLATIATDLDKVDAASLKAGDPTLGSPSSTGNIEPSDAKPTMESCGPPKTTSGRHGRVTLRWLGRPKRHGGILLELSTSRSKLRGVTVELSRGGHVLVRRRGLTLTGRRRKITLERRGGGDFPDGRYTIVVRRAGNVLVRRAVTVR